MCVVVKQIRSAITDTRFVEVPKPFSRGNKELFSCYIYNVDFLVLLLCHCFWLEVHGPYFPNKRSFPSASAVFTLKEMFHKSLIALIKAKCKELYSVMNSVNDICILRKKFYGVEVLALTISW